MGWKIELTLASGIVLNYAVLQNLNLNLAAKNILVTVFCFKDEDAYKAGMECVLEKQFNITPDDGALYDQVTEYAVAKCQNVDLSKA